MSQQSVRAERARRETCRNCKRWSRWDEDGLGRCGKFTRRNVMTFEHDTCENFVERKEEAR
jgi:hypothetical protein